MHELYSSRISMLKPGFYTDKPGWCLCNVISRASKVSTAWNIYHNDLPELRGIRVTFGIKILLIKDSKFHFNHKILTRWSFSLIYLIRELDNWWFYLTNQSFEWLIFLDLLNHHELAVCVRRAFESRAQQKHPKFTVEPFGYVYRVRRILVATFLSVICIMLSSTIFCGITTVQLVLTLFWHIPTCLPSFMAATEDACFGGSSYSL